MRAIFALLLFIQNVVNAETLRDLPDNFFSENAKTQISVVSEDSARKLFMQFSTQNFPWGQSETANQSRTHFMAKEAEKQGIKFGKVFLEGRLNYKPLAANWPAQMSWRTHAAPVVYVDQNGQLTLMALDPSITTEPVTIEDWKKLLQLKDDNHPPRISRLSFGSRFQYGPNDRAKYQYAVEDTMKMESTMKTLSRDI